jgi:hypothetical protein
LDLKNNSSETIPVKPKKTTVTAKTHSGWRGRNAYVLDFSETDEVKLKVSTNTVLHRLFKFCFSVFITFFSLNLFLDHSLIYLAVTIFALTTLVLLLLSFTSQQEEWLKLSAVKQEATAAKD